jgi:hypothetical protein
MIYSVVTHAETSDYWSYVCLLREDNILEYFAVMNELEHQVVEGDYTYNNLWAQNQTIEYKVNPKTETLVHHIKTYDRVKALVLQHKLNSILES